jgi:imidazole glycerol-phosphate synthase subunit HisH
VTAQVVIVASGGANIASLAFALERLGVSARLIDDPRELGGASHVILPGVGAARDSMVRLHASGFAGALPQLTRPLLGICLGMQLLYEHSEEGDTPGLGVIPGRVERIPARAGLAVPHMGWNQLEPRTESPLLEGIGAGDYAYFVHSYAAPLSAHTVAGAQYVTPMTAIVSAGNFYGVQFHPERSGAVGAAILRNFLRLD